MRPAGADLPDVLYTAGAVRELDRLAIERCAIPGIVLMHRAAAAAFAALRARWPRARRLVVLCGTGNNGGDGLLLARLARQAGLAVEVLLVGDAGRLTGDARLAQERLLAAGGQPRAYAGEALAPDDGATVLVDALFGTGLDRPVVGLQARALEAASAAGLPVLALDIPSGLHADTGAVLGLCLAADVTVTFIALKQGLFTGAGPARCGAIVLADLQVPPALLAAGHEAPAPAAWRVDGAALHGPHGLLPQRARDAHKGHHGHVLVVGGDASLGGAGRLCAEAAMRAGAGLVSLATHPGHAALCVAACPEAMASGVADAAALAPLLARASVLALGPGLGAGAWGQALFEACVERDLPKVVDADALNWLARRGGRRGDWVLTPHPGEAARLLVSTSAAVQADRFAAARALVARHGGVCVLKGAGTLVCDGARMAVIGTGNPGMASGGSGDVLTGVIAALLAQGLGPWEAALAGATAHGLAGDVAAGGGERGLLARDIIAALRGVLNP